MALLPFRFFVTRRPLSPPQPPAIPPPSWRRDGGAPSLKRRLSLSSAAPLWEMAARHTSPSLLDLPDDILFLVCQAVCATRGGHAVLVRTCKKLARIAREALTEVHVRLPRRLHIGSSPPSLAGDCLWGSDGVADARAVYSSMRDCLSLTSLAFLYNDRETSDGVVDHLPCIAEWVGRFFNTLVPLLQEEYASGTRGERRHPRLYALAVHGAALRIASLVWSRPLARLRFLRLCCVHTDEDTPAVAGRIIAAHAPSLEHLAVRLQWGDTLDTGAAALDAVFQGVPPLPCLSTLIVVGCVGAGLAARIAALSPGLRALDVEGGLLSGAMEAWSPPSLSRLSTVSLVYRSDVPRDFRAGEVQRFLRSRALHYLTLVPPDPDPPPPDADHEAGVPLDIALAISGCASPPVTIDFTGDYVGWSPTLFGYHCLDIMFQVPHARSVADVTIALPDDIHQDAMHVLGRLPHLYSLHLSVGAGPERLLVPWVVPNVKNLSVEFRVPPGPAAALIHGLAAAAATVTTPSRLHTLVVQGGPIMDNSLAVPLRSLLPSLRWITIVPQSPEQGGQMAGCRGGGVAVPSQDCCVEHMGEWMTAALSPSATVNVV